MIGSVILIVIAVILIIKTSNVKPDLSKNGSFLEKRFKINHIYGCDKIESGKLSEIIISEAIRIDDILISYDSIKKVQNYSLFLDKNYNLENIDFFEKNNNKDKILTDFLEIGYINQGQEKFLVIADLSGSDMISNVLQKIILFAAKYAKLNLMCNSIRVENSYLYKLKNEMKIQGK